MKQRNFEDLGELLVRGLPVDETVEFSASVTLYETEEARSDFFQYNGKVLLTNLGQSSSFDWKKKDRYALQCGDVNLRFHIRSKVHALGERSDFGCGGVRHYSAQIAIPIDITNNGLLVINDVSGIKY